MDQASKQEKLRTADEFSEVRIETPNLTVFVSSATTLDKAAQVARELFDRYRPRDSRLSSTAAGLHSPARVCSFD